MKNKLLLTVMIISLILSIVSLGLAIKIVSQVPEKDSVIIIEEGDTIINQTVINQTVVYIQIKLKMGYKQKFENGTIKRGIHNYNNGQVYNSSGSVWNVSVTVKFPYENETYRGYTEQVYYNVTDYIPLWGYYLWDVTEIDGLYYDAEAYGWQEVVA